MPSRGGFMDRVEELHRSLRPKKGSELSMKQAAYFFGGLYLVIHLLQYFDLSTLAILGTVGYILYRHAQNTIQLVSSARETSENERQQQQQPTPKTKSKGKKNNNAANQSTNGENGRI
mmetsp:Transcript_58140/g.101793  ORF Transcript_58140/g.101793 Transcript_58140/m.101793 type:complete len:118 (-) Transcript_58140:180-533(-)